MLLHKNVKRDVLRAVPLFAGCSREELNLVSSLVHEIDVPAGGVLAEEGVRGRDFLVLTAGEAEVRRGDRLLARLGAGQFLGEIALVRRTPRTATVVATTDVHALALDAWEFEELMGRAPGLHAKVLHEVRARSEHDQELEQELEQQLDEQ